MNEKHYHDLNTHLQNRYGEKVFRVCLDGGFTCPNRDGKKGYGGCIFCGGRGAGENLCGSLSISEQFAVNRRRIEQKHKAKKYIAYFQNFTGTYGSLAELSKKYTQALKHPDIAALSIATRPDCISSDIIALLTRLRQAYKVDIWIEMGLQTAHDKTARLINRGYQTQVFEAALDQLLAASIVPIAHILFGLPGESTQDMLDTVRFIAASGIAGVKFSALYVMKDTELARLYEAGRYSPMEMDTYIDLLIQSLALLPPEIVIHRLTGECTRSLLEAPAWAARKTHVMNEIHRRMKEQGIFQGCLFFPAGTAKPRPISQKPV